MTNISKYEKYDIVVVKFPFASSLKYKARPAVIISSDSYNTNKRDTLFIMAISSKVDDKIDFEANISHWKEAGLLKPSIFKSSLATIEQDFVITKIGKLSDYDIVQLDTMIKTIC